MTNDVKEYMSNHNIFSYFGTISPPLLCYQVIFCGLFVPVKNYMHSIFAETMRKPISEDADQVSKNPGEK